MKHDVGRRSTIEYDNETHEWVGQIHHSEGEVEYRSVELTQVVFNLAEMGEMEPNSYEWSNRGGVEQVLVVVPGETEEAA